MCRLLGNSYAALNPLISAIITYICIALKQKCKIVNMLSSLCVIHPLVSCFDKLEYVAQNTFSFPSYLCGLEVHLHYILGANRTARCTGSLCVCVCVFVPQGRSSGRELLQPHCPRLLTWNTQGKDKLDHCGESVRPALT